MTSPITELLTLLSRDGGQPRLTWYGTDGERIELSGAVLANWVTKTTNLLVEEFDAEAGVVVATDLPPHWRTLVWALATWRSGAELRLVDGGEGDGGGDGEGAAAGAPSPALTGAPDVALTADPARWVPRPGERRSRTAIVAVSLAALARRFDGELPAGAVDAASAVMTYGDQLGYVPPGDPGATALSGAGVALEVDHAALVGWAREHGATTPDGARVLLRTTDAPGAVAALLAGAVSVWAGGGSVVVLGPATTRAMEADPERLARLVETERVSVA